MRSSIAITSAITSFVIISREITSIEVVDINDSPGYYEEAVAEMPGRIKEEQQTDVDVVSGSTMSSEGIIRAVEDALAQ